MRSGAPFVAGWAFWLGALALMLWIWTPALLPPALLSYAAAGWMAIALILAIRGGPRESRRAVFESSLPTVLVAFGLAVTLTGLAFGLWLVLIGGEIVLLGLAGLVAEELELRARRRRTR
jgi:hypothetical protein